LNQGASKGRGLFQDGASGRTPFYLASQLAARYSGLRTFRISYAVNAAAPVDNRTNVAPMSDQRPEDSRTARYTEHRLNALYDLFADALATGAAPRIEDYLPLVIASDQIHLLVRLAGCEMAHRQARGESPTREEYETRFPVLAGLEFDQPTGPLNSVDVSATRALDFSISPPGLICPHCRQSFPVMDQADDEVLCPGCGEPFRIEEPHLPSTVEAVRRLGKFHLVQCLGRGTYGEVWRAIDSVLHVSVAIKIPHASLIARAEYRGRLEIEAQSAARLRGHPGIAQLYDYPVIDGRLVLVYEFIEGTTLHRLLKIKPLGFRDTARIVAEIAEALEYAHSQKVVHRDIKPANIMMAVDRPGIGVREGQRTEDRGPKTEDRGQRRPDHAPLTTHHAPPLRPVIVDFGLALQKEAEEAMTIEGQLLGTVAYMSPEQAIGQAHLATNQTDIYSLGVVLYEMLAGKLPFHGSKAMLIHQIMREEPRPLRAINDHIPRDLETIALTAMNKEPAKRYATAGAMARDLRNYLEDRPIAARPAGRVERTVRWCKRNPRLALSIGVAAAGFVFAMVMLIFWNMEKSSSLYASQRNEALLALDRALDLLQKDETNLGLLWLGRSLERAPSDDEDLQRVIRTNISAWLGQTHELVDMIPCATGGQESFALSADGQKAAVGGGGEPAQFWDLQNRKPLTAPLAHSTVVWHPTLSADGRWGASAPNDHSVQLWDLNLGKPWSQVLDHGRTIESVCFSQNGRSLLTQGADHAVRVWKIPVSKSGSAVLAHPAPIIKDAAISDDGENVLTICRDHIARLWQVSSGSCVSSLKDSRGFSFGAISPRSEFIILVTNDVTANRSTVRRYSPDFKLIWETDIGHGVDILQIRFRADSNAFVTVARDSAVTMWDARVGKPMGPPMRHKELARTASFDPSGRWLATGGADRTVRIWDSLTSNPLGLPLAHESAIRAMAFSSKTLVTGTEDGMGRIWRVSDVSMGHAQIPQPAKVWAAAWSPDATRIVVASGREMAPGTGSWWELPAVHSTGPKFQHCSTIARLAISRDGRRLATASFDKTARLWDSETLQPLCPPLRHSDFVMGVAFHPDGRHVLTGSLDRTARLWNIETGEPFGQPLVHGHGVRDVAISRDGRHALTACVDRKAYLWDLNAPGAPARIFAHPNVVRAVRFAPDGEKFATGGDDGTARLWTVTGRQLFVLPHAGPVQCLAFSIDGRTVATGSADGTVRLWDVALGRLLGPAFLHDLDSESVPLQRGGVWTVEFSLDGRRLLSGGWDHSVHLWNVPLRSREAVTTLLTQIQIATAMELDSTGAARDLDRSVWQARQQSNSID
jgi:WD40 repeat protein/serine/threonine protein kinase